MKKIILTAVAVFGFAFANAQEEKSGFKASTGNLTTELSVNGLIDNVSFNLQDQGFDNEMMFKARYFKSESIAYRGLFTIGVDSETTKMNPDDLKESTTKIGLGFGVEKHFAGTDRLSPYVGGDLLVGFNSSKVEQGSYEEKGPNGFRLGVRGVFGADYYFAKNLYLGVEAGLGIFYHNTGKTEINGTTVNDGSNRFEITPSVVGGVRVGFIMF